MMDLFVLAQQIAPDAGSQATAHQLTSQFVLASVVSWIIQWVKDHPGLEWMDQYTPRLNRAVSILLAAVAVLGLQWTYDAVTGTLIVTGLTVTSITTAGWEWFKQFVLQETVYRAAFKPARAPASD